MCSIFTASWTLLLLVMKAGPQIYQGNICFKHSCEMPMTLYVINPNQIHIVGVLNLEQFISENVSCVFLECSEAIFRVKHELIDMQVGPYLESLTPVFRVCLQPDQDPALRISFLQVCLKRVAD